MPTKTTSFLHFGRIHLTSLVWNLFRFRPGLCARYLNLKRALWRRLSRSTHLIGDVINLHHFASMNEIEKTYIVTPANLNKTESWSIQKTRSISKAIYQLKITRILFTDLKLKSVEFFRLRSWWVWWRFTKS